MIQGVGYTDDGLVWVNVVFDHNGKPGTMLLTMSQDMARIVSKDLITAANEAGEKFGVRNSANTH